MGLSHFSILAVVLISGSPAAAQVDQIESDILGDRGRLVQPVIPGPPTYRPAAGENRKPADRVCDTPSPGYLDPRLARRPPPLDVEELYKGWLAGELIGQDVYGRNGEQLGEVREILVGGDGKVVAIVVEGGGFLEIGDAAFRVPWNMVRRKSGGGVVIDLTQKAAEKSGLFDGSEEIIRGRREFRISEILGDWTRIGNETDPCQARRGYVKDVVIDRDGRIAAILETRSARLGGGIYAFPFFSYQEGWRPFYGYYDLSYENMSKPAPKVDLSRFGAEVTTGEAASSE